MVILISAARHSRSTRARTSRRKDENRLLSRFPVSLFDAYYCNELMETRQVKRLIRGSAIAGGILAATTLGLACLRYSFEEPLVRLSYDLRSVVIHELLCRCDSESGEKRWIELFETGLRAFANAEFGELATP